MTADLAGLWRKGTLRADPEPSMPLFAITNKKSASFRTQRSEVRNLIYPPAFPVDPKNRDQADKQDE